MNVVLPIAPRQRTTRPAINENMALRETIKAMELDKYSVHTLGDLCGTHGIQRRVLYDFISMMERFNCCTRVNNERFRWNGLENARVTIEDMKAKFQGLLDEQECRNILLCSQDPSLPHVAESVVGVFVYLNVTTLNVRDICRFLTLGTMKYQTMLRKLYTVGARLEAAGVLERTGNSGEIRLCNFKIGDTRQIKLMDMLNTEYELKLETTFAERRRAFYGRQSTVSGYRGSSGSSPETAFTT